jgi:hypothetical protein
MGFCNSETSKILQPWSYKLVFILCLLKDGDSEAGVGIVHRHVGPNAYDSDNFSIGLGGFVHKGTRSQGAMMCSQESFIVEGHAGRFKRSSGGLFVRAPLV